MSVLEGADLGQVSPGGRSRWTMLDLGEERDRRLRAQAILGEAFILEVIDAGLRELERERAS